MAPMVSGANTSRYVYRRVGSEASQRPSAAVTTGPDSSLLAIDGWHMYVESSTSSSVSPGITTSAYVSDPSASVDSMRTWKGPEPSCSRCDWVRQNPHVRL